jgi:hypothetical protein
MADYSAGSAKATYELDLSPLRASVLEAKRLYAELAQASQQASQPRGTSTVVPRSMAPNAINVGSGPGIDKAAVASAKLAAEQNKAALAAQRLATEEQRTAIQLANVERAESQAASAALRLSQQQDKANASASKGKSAFGQMAEGVKGIQGILGAAGIGLGVNTLVQGGIAAGQYSVGVRQTEAVLRQLSGSQARYNELTKIAAQNQRLFGGSLAENYAPLTGVLALANQTGASLGQLNGVTQLLLAKAPGKSAGDAFFGLGEFLSGKGAEAALSLADQFNLNKGAIAALAAEGVSAQDRLSGLTRLLAEQGVTSETLTARLTDQAVAYNEAGAKVDSLKLKIGDLIAKGFTPAARGLTMVLNVVDSSTTAMDKAGNGQTKTTRETQANELVQGAKDYEDYIARLRVANESMPWGQGFFELSAAQYAATRAALDHAAAAEQDGASSATVANSYQAEANAARAAADATAAANAASQADAITKMAASAQTDVLKLKNDELAAAVRSAAAGSDAASWAAAQLAAVYGEKQYPALLAIIGALREKAALEGAKGGGGLLGNLGDLTKNAKEKTDAMAAAQLRYTEATESSAARVARLRAELTHLTRGSAAYIDQQTKIKQAEQALASERTKSGTSADKAATKVAGAANAEAVAQRDAMRRIETMTQDHHDKLRRLEEDYTLSSSRKTEDYQLERQRLLANGQIKEAQLLEEKFRLDQKRAAEDNARGRQRETEQAAQSIADAQQQAGLKADDRERKRMIGGVALSGDAGAAAAAAGAGAARQAQAEAALASSAGQRPSGGMLRIEFAPISLVADGQTLANVVYPAIETRIDEFLAGEIATILVTSPPGGGQGAGVGGPTP